MPFDEHEPKEDRATFLWKSKDEWGGIAGLVLSKNEGFFKSAINMINMQRSQLQR